jgi:hypothetical protein
LACFIVSGVLGVISASVTATSAAAMVVSAPQVTSKMFTGVKANTGTVSLDMKDGHYVLTLSDDFKTPDTPAPHWQIVDSAGNTFLLDRLKTKGASDRANRSIIVPDYVHDIAKVQIYCAWAEAVLGETAFNGVQVLMTDASHSAPANTHMSSKFAGVKANTGTVTHSVRNSKSTLTLSNDFVTPDTPAPHWRIVDSSGKTYLLQSLKTKGENDKANRSIAIPAYIPDVAKAQIYCAWAEVVLGEALFDHPVK